MKKKCSASVLLAIVALAAGLTVGACGGSSRSSAGGSARRSEELGIPRQIVRRRILTTADVVASLCRQATLELGDSKETEAPAALRALAAELRRLRVSGAWKRKIDRYVSALHRELPLESTMAVVAKTGEEYPLGRLIGAREAELKNAAHRLGVKDCASEPL